ncbi:hypothetical protein MTO96_029673 [Rhipicephalus appendiculatus]
MTTALVKDRCWTIPIVAACCAFITLFTSTSSGLMYILFMEEFRISHEQAAWPHSTHVVVANCIGFLLSALQQKLTVYHITLISAMLVSTGLIASSFAPDIIWRTVLLGGINGAGSGMLLTSLSLYTLSYFERYRATATAFKFAGVALSGIVGPSLMGYLAENYGCKGSLLLAAGISANAIPFLVLLKHPSPLDAPACCEWSKASESTTPEKTGTSLGMVKVASLFLVPAPIAISRRDCAEGKTDSLGSLRQPSTMELSDKNSVSKSNQRPSDTRQRLTEDKPQAPTEVKSLQGHRKAALREDRSHHNKPLQVKAPNFLAHCGTLLRSGKLYILLVSYVMMDFVVQIHDTIIVEYGVDKKVCTLKQCNQLQTFNAVGQLLGRLVVPFISDKMPLSRCAFTSTNLLIVAACLLLTSFVQDYITLSMLTAAIGVCQGYLLCIKVVLVGEYLGVESLGLVSGLMGIFLTPVVFSVPALIASNVIRPAQFACRLVCGKEPAFVGNMTSTLVKDRCWTVPIVAACCGFIIFFTSSSSGLMYILFMEEFRISHEQAAWPQSTHVVVGNCIGAGSGMLLTSFSLYTLSYFERYRATAIAFKYAGVALSGIVGPSLMGYLAENYSCKGSLLLAGGIGANAIPLIMLLKNPEPLGLPACCEWSKASESTTPEKTGTSLGMVKVASLSLVPELSTISRRECAEEKTDSLGSLRQPSMKELRDKNTVSKRNQCPSDTQQGLTKDKSEAPAQGKSLQGHRKAALRKDRSHHNKPLQVRAPNFLVHCGTLLRSGNFYVLLVSHVMIDFVVQIHETVIVDYGVDKKVGTLKQCNQLQTFNAVGQLSGRLVVPFISDKMPLSRCAFASTNLLIVAACILLTSFVQDYVTLSLLTAAIGVCEGYLLCIKVVLVGEYLGVESLGLFYGLVGIFLTPVALSAPALIARNVIPPAQFACRLVCSEEPAFVRNMTSTLVKDRCWTVPIVAACCGFITFFTSSSSGLMYILFMEEFHISHEQAAWPQSTYVVLENCIVFRSGKFYILLVSYVMIDFVVQIHDTIIVEYGVDKKVGTLAQCNQLQTFNAVGQLLGRLVVPLISDMMPLSRCTFTSANLLIVAACLLLTAVLQDFVTLSLLTAVIGICEGYLRCIRVVLVGEYLGVESLGLVYGLVGIFLSPVALSAPALIGYFRDTIGSYDQFYWLLAAVKFGAASLICSIAVADRRRQNTWNIDHGHN